MSLPLSRVSRAARRSELAVIRSASRMRRRPRGGRHGSPGPGPERLVRGGNPLVDVARLAPRNARPRLACGAVVAFEGFREAATPSTRFENETSEVIDLSQVGARPNEVRNRFLIKTASRGGRERGG